MVTIKKGDRRFLKSLSFCKRQGVDSTLGINEAMFEMCDKMVTIKLVFSHSFLIQENSFRYPISWIDDDPLSPKTILVGEVRPMDVVTLRPANECQPAFYGGSEIFATWLSDDVLCSKNLTIEREKERVSNPGWFTIKDHPFDLVHHSWFATIDKRDCPDESR